MRKKWYFFLILALVVIAIISGCTSKKESVKDKKVASKSEEETVKEEKENEIKKIMTQFNSLISEKREPYEIVKFIDENIAKVSQVEATEMINELEKSQEGFIKFYTDELYKENRQNVLVNLSSQLEFDKSRIEEIEDDELKSIVTKIFQGKFKLINIEGTFDPIIDYSGLKEYSKYLSEEMKSYIDLKAVESDGSSMLDGGVAITWDELGNRLIRAEKYATKYPEGIKCEEVKRIYGEYLIMYLSGADNTPIYNIENKKILKDVLENYKKFIVNNKDTISSDIVSKYLDLIEKNEFIIDETITSSLVELYNEAISRLEECK